VKANSRVSAPVLTEAASGWGPKAGQADDQRDQAREHVDDPDLPVGNAPQHPQAVQAQHGAHVEQRQTQPHRKSPFLPFCFFEVPCAP
jgi:hypothetical protein